MTPAETGVSNGTNSIVGVSKLLACQTKKMASFITYILFVVQTNAMYLIWVEDLQKLEANGIVAYDAFLKEPVLLIAPVICMIGDNPRQSEIMNHAGTNAKMFCRMCMVSFIANDLSFYAGHDRKLWQ